MNPSRRCQVATRKARRHSDSESTTVALIRSAMNKASQHHHKGADVVLSLLTAEELEACKGAMRQAEQKARDAMARGLRSLPKSIHLSGLRIRLGYSNLGRVFFVDRDGRRIFSSGFFAL